MTDNTALNQVIANIETNAAAIKEALRTASYGQHVYVWPNYWLGVSFKGNDCRGVAVDRATIVKANDRHVFTNGHGQQAVLMNRDKALQGALSHTLALLEQFKSKLAA